LDRRAFIRLTGFAAAFGAGAGRALGAAKTIDAKAILDDPEAPVGGNPKGNTPIVAFLDYNCPYCRATALDLKRFVANDGEIRLVYKDWPILAISSVYGARLALAANLQGQYQAAHDALMAIRGGKTTEATMRDAVKAADVDMGKLDSDLGAHDKAIMRLIKRNDDQAKALGLEGTPTYLIGPFLIAQPLNYEGFREAVQNFHRHLGK
jgi:protein-disulfide isomerase